MEKGERDAFLDLAKRRRTCYEFSDKEVNNADIQKILEAGQWAPTFGNLQNWRYLVIKDKKIIAEVMKAVTLGAFHTQPAAIIVLMAYEESPDTKKRGAEDNKTHRIDNNICIGFVCAQMILEATSLNVDSAILSPDKDIFNKTLKLNEGYSERILIGLGYERENAFRKKKARRSLKELEYK